MRYQDPKIQRRADVARPFYFIRPVVPVITAEGVTRRQQSVRLGWCDEMTKREAERAKQTVMATINTGRVLVQSQISFRELVAKFIAIRVPQLGVATQRRYRSHLDSHILPAFGALRLCDIDRATVQAWLNSKRDAGLAWWTLTGLRNLLSAIFSQAAAWRLWEGENPTHGVEVGRKKEAREKRILDSGQLSAFLAALPDTAILSAERARLVVLIAVVAGLRVSEVLGLQWGDIDVLAQALTVRRRWHRGDLDQPKTEASSRTRAIGELAGRLAAMRNGAKPDAFLFARADGLPPDDRDLQQHVFRRTAARLGLYFTGFGMHSFRRANITWRQQAGATPFEAMRAAGHTRPETTWLYTIADRDREVEQVGRIWERIGDGRAAVQ